MGEGANEFGFSKYSIMNNNQKEKILKALANKRRLAIIKYLNRKGRAIVSDIAEEIKLSFRSTSRHLAVLIAADAVVRNQHGLNAYYNINAQDKAVRDFIKFILKF